MTRSQTILATVGLFAMVLLAYSPLVDGGFIWDDDAYVTHNAHLESAAGLRRIWFERGAVPQYYPLVHTTFWLERRAWGLNPLGYHAINVLLHACSAVLLWRVLLRLGLPVAASWFAAALFAVHPVHVESVAWITERKNTLSLTLALASLLCYLRFQRFTPTPSQGAGRGEGRAPTLPHAASPALPHASDVSHRPLHLTWYLAACLLFLGALLSKSVTSSLPAVILVLLWWKHGRLTWRDAAWLSPFFAVGIGLGLNTAAMERQIVGAFGPEFDFTPIDRMLIAGRALWFYAWKLLWPQTLTFFYPRWSINAGAAWQYLFPLAAVAVMASLLLARHRIGRGPAAAVFIFAGVLFPALGFVNVYPMVFSFVADHFQYHASIGLLTLLAAGWARWRQHSPRPRVLVTLAALWLVALMARTWVQSHHYHDIETLWRATLRDNPNAWGAWANLSDELKRQGRWDEATAAADRALALRPSSLAHVNMALLLLRDSRRELAMEHLRQAIELDPTRGEPHHLLANQLALDPATLPQAVEHYRQAIRVGMSRPVFTDEKGWLLKQAVTHESLGRALLQLGQTDEAAAALAQSVQWMPRASACQALGMALMKLDRLDDALAALRQAAELEPTSAVSRHNLGSLLQRMGQSREAAQQWRQSLALDPQRVTTLRSLAWLLATDPDPSVRDGDEAVRWARQALTLAADDPALLDVAAAAHARAGNFNEAITAASRAVTILQQQNQTEPAQAVAARLARYRLHQAYVAGEVD